MAFVFLLLFSLFFSTAVHAGAISGQVTDAATGEPISGVTVVVSDAAGRTVTLAQVGNGVYEAEGLDAGRYFAYARVHSGQPYISEIYDDIPCMSYFGPCESHRVGKAIPVADDAVTDGIDFALDLGGGLSGRITDAATGKPLRRFTVKLWTPKGVEVSSVSSDDRGRYEFPPPMGQPLITGRYVATVTRGDGYLGEVWGGSHCLFPPLGRCDLTGGALIEIEDGRETSGIDFALERAGTIEGRVVSASTGEPEPEVEVRARDAHGVAGKASSGADGRYRLEDLLPGAYMVFTSSSRHLNLIYDGRPCPESFCAEETGDPVQVGIARVTGSIDFALRHLGGFSGRVTAQETREGLQGLLVSAWPKKENGRVVSVDTDEDGRYSFPSLVPGKYYATAYDLGSREWVSELYDELPCPRVQSACDVTAGAPIKVRLEKMVEGIDFTLERAGTVSGRVLDTDGKPIGRAFVDLYTADGERAADGISNDDGIYSTRGVKYGLGPGDYFALAYSDSHLHEVYDNLTCPRFDILSCDLEQATPVTVRNATDRTVDFTLAPGGSIAGRITDAATGEPIRKTLVWGRDAAGEYVDVGASIFDGSYRIGGLPAGTYYVTADHENFKAQLYPDLPCPGGACDVTAGTPVTVVVESEAEGIDFALEPGAYEDDQALYLLNERFQVRARWRDSKGHTGDGRAVRLTDGTGVFSFFGDENVELMVKMLDACNYSRSFWVFAAGLTNVEVQLEVTDLVTGVRWSHTSPLGSAFAPVLDTQGIATCNVVGPQTAGEEVPAAAAELLSRTPELVHAETTEMCQPSTRSLCLKNGRFQLETQYRAANGSSGFGHALPLTDHTGIFWFFQSDNLELIVKVLDACVEPFDHFWVFVAGLTDVEVTLRVTDLESGEVREYVNPLGQAFQPIQDTAAFATCPPP